jgi:hypothetical protein
MYETNYFEKCVTYQKSSTSITRVVVIYELRPYILANEAMARYIRWSPLFVVKVESITQLLVRMKHT